MSAGSTVHVRVPATSANLGPGFDTLGLALTLFDDVYATVTDGGLRIEIDGEGADLADAGEKHLVIQAMRAAFDRYADGVQPPGIALRCVNRIPHGRGLGSSAAAIVAGVLSARALASAAGTGGTAGAGASADPLALATEIEGHPDNVAACLLGGLTIAWTPDVGPARAIRLDPAAGIQPVVCIAPPDVAVSTDLARQALPGQVPHAAAAANAGRAALLIAALTQPGLAGELLPATRDWLHQDYRRPAMPDTYALVTALRRAGIAAVISGAGPSVLALVTSQDETSDGPGVDSVGSIVRETGKPWHISSLDVARRGACVQRVGERP
ncbi:MAG TPA: homoserine kinase [Streptosporangiaceae bacterium]|nr:homoserine kinase [Streptosporangiaceae bacterium]